MVVIDNSFSIVVAGNWNRSILNPTWVAERLFEKDHVSVEITISNDFTPRYFDEGIKVIPDKNKVSVFAEQINDAKLNESELIIKRLVSILDHTPVSGLGFNFAYLVTEEGEKAELYTLFNLTDINTISDNGYEIAKQNLKRSLVVGERIVNLTITVTSESDFLFEFNFHHDFDNNSAINDFLNGNQFLLAKDTSLEIIDRIYGITLSINE